jgi:hypothetical protein
VLARSPPSTARSRADAAAAAAGPEAWAAALRTDAGLALRLANARLARDNLSAELRAARARAAVYTVECPG